MKTLFAILSKSFRRAERPVAPVIVRNRAGSASRGIGRRAVAAFAIASAATAIGAGTASAQEFHGPSPAPVAITGTFAPGWPTCAPTPAAPYPINGVDSATCNPRGGELPWAARGPLPWQPHAQGEYVGPSRWPHVEVYRLRPDDEIDFVYRLTRDESPTPYELNVGDTIKIESLTDAALARELVIQPDGTITLPLLAPVKASGKTVEELRRHLEEEFKTFYNVPSITVTPIKVNTKLEDLRATVDSRSGFGGQSITVKVTPDGTVQLPGIGTVSVIGMTLEEAKREVDLRYTRIVDGIEAQPVLKQRAPRYVYVLGEVPAPGRYELTGPTTAMQAIALSGGWKIGGNLRQIVVFRRAEDWRMMATKLDLQGALYGKRPNPADEIWMRDSDVLLVPKSPIQLTDDFIELVFTRGIYGVVPFQGVAMNFSKASTL